MQSSARSHPVSAVHALAHAIDGKPLLVVAFCAAWCDTCEDFGAEFDRMAADRNDATFVWLDIEEHADLVGEIDIENFPTIAVFHRHRPIHFGTSLPQGPIVRRLLDSLDEHSRTIPVGADLARLPGRLRDLAADDAARMLRGT